MDQVLKEVPEVPPGVVDLVALRDGAKRIQDAVVRLDERHQNGVLLPVVYRKSMVWLARYYVKLGDVPAAAELLAKLPQDFYHNDLPMLMSDDAAFCRCALKLADALVEQGVVDVTYRHNTPAEIQPLGLA